MIYNINNDLQNMYPFNQSARIFGLGYFLIDIID